MTDETLNEDSPLVPEATEKPRKRIKVRPVEVPPAPVEAPGRQRLKPNQQITIAGNLRTDH